jgi:CubicO group peptidase (beta-lactamase class C family)
MHNSLVIQPGIRIKERAQGYEYGNETHSLSDAGESMFFSTMGDGGIYTSADEYLKWMTMILNRKGPDHKLVDQVLMPQFVIDSTRQLSYGYGWFVAGSGRNRIAYHTGSNGGFRAIVFSKPSEKYGVIILSNRTGIDLEDLVHQINNILRVDDTAFVRLESLIN